LNAIVGTQVKNINQIGNNAKTYVQYVQQSTTNMQKPEITKDFSNTASVDISHRQISKLRLYRVSHKWRPSTAQNNIHQAKHKL